MAARGKANGGFIVLAISAVIVLAVLTQKALVNGFARVMADLWVSTVAIVLKLFAAVFGAH